MFTEMLAGWELGGRRNTDPALFFHVRPSSCLVRAMVVLEEAVAKPPHTVKDCQSGAMVTLTAVAAEGILLMVISWMSIVLRCRPSVTVFAPPSTSVAVAEAAIRSVNVLPSFSAITVLVVASSFAGSVKSELLAPPTA